MSLVIPVAHDFICPWCWIALFQAQDLEREFGVTFDWKGYELFPEELEWPDAPAKPAGNPEKPATPSRLDLAYAAQGMTPPTARGPKKMRTFRAHQALEYAKDAGKGQAFLEILYRALYEDGAAINEIEVLLGLAKGVIEDLDDFRSAIEEKRFADRIVGFDDPANAAGVYNVPTFWIAGERLAEQPLSVLRAKVQQALRETASV